jgi:hypothetical protein
MDKLRRKPKAEAPSGGELEEELFASEPERQPEPAGVAYRGALSDVGTGFSPSRPG